MSFLKKIGMDFLKVLPVILGVGPIFGNLIPDNKGGAIVQRVLGDLNAIPQLVITVESLYQSLEGQKLGSEKLSAIAPHVAQLIRQYAENNLPGSPHLKDAAKLAQAAAQITSGFVDALNAFGD